jgi:hypothetical protein
MKYITFRGSCHSSNRIRACCLRGIGGHKMYVLMCCTVLQYFVSHQLYCKLPYCRPTQYTVQDRPHGRYKSLKGNKLFEQFEIGNWKLGIGFTHSMNILSAAASSRLGRTQQHLKLRKPSECIPFDSIIRSVSRWRAFNSYNFMKILQSLAK